MDSNGPPAIDGAPTPGKPEGPVSLMQNISDAEIALIHKHVERRWADLHWALVDDEKVDDVFDPARVYMTSSKVHVHYHKHSFEMGLDASRARPDPMEMAAFVAHFDACLRRLAERIADELVRFGAKRSQLTLKQWDFEEPRDAWLPIETIALTVDLIRVGCILHDK